jgi:tetratricopeptide (TPR) repeat protein
MTKGAAPSKAPDPEVMRQVDAAIRARQIPRAIELALAELERGAEHPQLLHLRSTWLDKQGRPLDALADLERARALNPRELAVLMALGLSLAQLTRRLEARQVFEEAAALRPDLVGPVLQIGWVSEGVGEVTRARAAYASALELEPTNAHAMTRLAAIAAQQGEWAEARAWAERAVAANPKEAAAHLTHVRADIHEGKLAEAEQRLLMLLGERLSPEHAYLAQKELGSLRHRQKRYPEAFAAWAKGNEIAYRDHAPLFGGERSSMALMGLLGEHFAGEEAWERSPEQAAPSPAQTHVFLLGFARSGTTLLEQVLAAHPDVVAMEEKEVLASAVEAFRSSPQALRALRDATDEALAPFRETYWREAAGYGYRPTARVFLDKSPFNASRLPLIARLFPDAKILFAVRDPRDVVLSCFRTPFRTNGITFQLLRIEDAGRFYAAYMHVAQLFREKLPLQLLTVRHEDLLDDFEGRVREVCDFIGIDLRPGMLDFANAQRLVATPSAHQLRAGLSRAGAGQWTHYAQEMAPALGHLAPWVERFGYQP